MNTLLKPLDEEFFFPFLRRSLGNSDFQVFPLAGDASNRRYFRVVHQDDSMVLMVWDPFKDDGNYPFLSVLRFFQKAAIAVPMVVGMDPEEGLVLLEDLGDLTLERKFWESQSQETVVPYYEASLDELIKIHYETSKVKDDCTALHVSFDTEKLLWEMNYGRTHLLEKLAKLELKQSETTALNEIFLDICQKLDQEPKVVCHRDYHSRNVMIKLGSVRVIDFQDARMGPIQYDLVSLIKDSYVNMNENLSNHLLNYYLLRRSEITGETVDRAHFDYIYELQSIQRCFKACGSFASFLNLRNDRRYLRHISPTLRRVKKSLQKFPEYQGFLEILEGYGVLEEDYLAL